MNAKFREEEYKMDSRKLRLLQEAKEDREKFKAWGGESLFKRFMELKNRLSPPENDMLYWASTKSPHEPWELDAILTELENKSAQNKQKQKGVDDGATLLYKDDSWLVYHITNHSACVKYGKNTQWCITNPSDNYWADYTEDGSEFYFFICRNPQEKFAVLIRPDGSYEIYNENDEEISYIPDAPQVDGLPDFTKPNTTSNFDDDYDDYDDTAEQLPPPYELIPVENPNNSVFSAPTVEESARMFKNSEVVSLLKEDNAVNIYSIKTEDGKYTMFVYHKGMHAGGPFMTSPDYRQFAIILFADLERMNSWVQENAPHIGVKTDADLEELQRAHEQAQQQGDLQPQQQANEELEGKQVDDDFELITTVDEFPINTLQSMIDNTRFGDFIVYQNGDNPVFPTNKKFLDENGNIFVAPELGLTLINYTDVEDGELMVEGANEVVSAIRGFGSFDEPNATPEMVAQVEEWLEKTFPEQMAKEEEATVIAEGIMLLYTPEEQNESPALEELEEPWNKHGYSNNNIDDEPEPLLVESYRNFTNLQFLK